MTGTPRRRAPYPEWVLMYRKGLSRGQIADLTGAAPATVGYHLGLARTQDPNLQNEHDVAARKPAVTGQGRERLQQLVSSGQDWPRHKATVTGQEHELGVWPHTQRFRQRRGELDPAKADALDTAAPGWRTGRTRGRKPKP